MDSRVTNSISFNTNVKTSEYDDSQRTSLPQQAAAAPLLPAGTAISEEIRQVFNFSNVEKDLLHFLEAACTNPTLRSAADFQRALRQTFLNLSRQTKDGHPSRAAQILQQLLEDKALLDWYRALIIDN